MSHIVNPEQVEEMEAHFLSRSDKINRWGNVISSFQALPGLVGFWPMSSVQRSTGNAYDLSGQTRGLTYNGNPTYNFYNDFIPYIDLDGTGDFLSRADETDLDILGTETIYNSAVRGLTMGGWFWVDAVGSTVGLVGKSLNTGNQRSYLIYSNPSATVANAFEFFVSNDGSTTIQVQANFAPSTGTWYFVAGRYIPSTEIKLWVSGSTYTNTTSIPASLLSGTANFQVGAFNGGAQNLDGRASLCFLSANALSDALINGLFQQSRVLFGV